MNDILTGQCTENMTVRVYPRPVCMVLSAILDIIELQKAKLSLSDTPNGKISFIISMYAYNWEFCFTVKDMGDKRSCVNLEVKGEQIGLNDISRSELSLLDFMLASGNQGACYA